jgi:ribosomal protein L11 methyltransferase
VSWRQLIVRVPADRVAGVEALLRLAGAEAITLSDAADSPMLEPPPGETPLWPDVDVHALFPGDVDADALESLLAASLPAGVRIESAELSDDDWQRAAQRAAPPRRFGKKLWLVPAESDTPGPDGTAVRLRMGLAFGTGEHPTTAACLEWLDAHPPSGAEVLDYGCGSGVLALASLALGARYAWAVDNDPQALTATASNAALNAASERLWIGAPEALPCIEVDLVVANILARPLLERRAYFARCLRPGGRIVLSGVLEAQSRELLDAYVAEFEALEVASRGGWVRITGRRRGV